MKIAYISVIHPADNDIIHYTLIYYYNLGIRNFYLMLHKSNDELTNIIKDVVDKLYLSKFKIFYSDDNDHRHEKQSKILLDQAKADGFKWIIASDADELLVLKKHKNIEDLIIDYDSINYLSLNFTWYECKIDKDIKNENPFVELKYFAKEPRDFYKSIGKFNDGMVFCSGFHTIVNNINELTDLGTDSCIRFDDGIEPQEVYKISPDVAFYLHFPHRTNLQFKNKMKLQVENWAKIGYPKYYHVAEKMLEEDPELKHVWNLMIEKNQNKINSFKINLNPEMFRI